MDMLTVKQLNSFNATEVRKNLFELTVKQLNSFNATEVRKNLFEWKAILHIPSLCHAPSVNKFTVQIVDPLAPQFSFKF
jgi:hypothetical protein